MRSRTWLGLFLVIGLVGLAGSPTLAADKQITLTWTAGGLGAVGTPSQEVWLISSTLCTTTSLSRSFLVVGRSTPLY